METFLSAVGIVAITFVVLVGAIALYAWYKIRRFLRGVRSAVLGPEEIHLEPASGTWEHAQELETARALLSAHGFDSAGEYSIKEMHGVRLAAFVKPSDAFVAVAYEHSEAGFWVDLIQRYRDGTSLTVTSAPMGHELDQPPELRKLYHAGMPADELYERFRSECDGRPALAIGATGFVGAFERAYADEMQWRRKHGVTAAEVGRIAEGMEDDEDEDEDENERAGRTSR